MPCVWWISPPKEAPCASKSSLPFLPKGTAENSHFFSHLNKKALKTSLIYITPLVEYPACSIWRGNRYDFLFPTWPRFTTQVKIDTVGSLGRSLSEMTTGMGRCLVFSFQLSSGCVTWINLSFCRTQDGQEQEQHQGHSGNRDHFGRWSWIWSLQPTNNARKQKEKEKKWVMQISPTHMNTIFLDNSEFLQCLFLYLILQ